MKRERKTPIKVKSRKRSTSSSSRSNNEDRIETRASSSRQQKEPKPRMLIEESVSRSNVTVRLENADMLTKYRNKNPHLKIVGPTTTTNFAPDEISDDDEIWICDVPNSIDITKLAGKSIKLGSKRSTIEIDDGEIEFSSLKYDNADDIYQNTMSVVFQDNDSKLAIKNIKPAGEISFYKKIRPSDEPIELTPTGRHECTLFPENLLVRHPLLGRNFKDKINVNETIKKKLAETKTASEQVKPSIVIKQEKEESTTQSPVKKTKKRKAGMADSSISVKKPRAEIKTETEDDDLDCIKQILAKAIEIQPVTPN